MSVQCSRCQTIFQMDMIICSNCGRVIPKNQTEREEFVKQDTGYKSKSEEQVKQKHQLLRNNNEIRLKAIGKYLYSWGSLGVLVFYYLGLFWFSIYLLFLIVLKLIELLQASEDSDTNLKSV